MHICCVMEVVENVVNGGGGQRKKFCGWKVPDLNPPLHRKNPLLHIITVWQCVLSQPPYSKANKEKSFQPNLSNINGKLRGKATLNQVKRYNKGSLKVHHCLNSPQNPLTGIWNHQNSLGFNHWIRLESKATGKSLVSVAVLPSICINPPSQKREMET